MKEGHLHYQFTHHLLRQTVFNTDPSELRSLIQNRQFGDFCFDLVMECFGTATDPTANIDAIVFEAEMGIFEVLNEDVQMVLISMPTPQSITQAHYVLIALAEKPRFFTLEATTDSLDRLDSSFGFLCEWTVNGTHQNYGNCSLHPAKFIRGVMHKVRNLQRRLA